jgi:hypothetical protein
MRSEACLILAFVAVTASAQYERRQYDKLATVPPILRRAIRAQPTLRYTGTTTTEYAQGANSGRHQEYVIKDGPWYRIDFPNDSQFAGQVIVENNEVRLHYHPIANEIVQEPPRHGEAWQKVANLANNPKFVLSTASGDFIAGFRTEQLVVSDTSGNVLQRLFIEPGSGVILKRQLFDLVGMEKGSFEFSKIDLSPRIDPQAFVLKRKNAKVIIPRVQLERISKRRGFQLRFLPPASGFLLEGTVAKNFAGIEGLVETYLGGKVRLWIYVLKAPVDPDRLRKNAGKNLHVYSYESNGETIVLMGNVDERTLTRFGSMIGTGTSPLGH